MRRTVARLLLGGTITAITIAGAAACLHRSPGQLGSLPASGGRTDDTGRAARFNYPAGVAVDAAGTVYVADQGSHTIRQVSPAGKVSTLAGEAGRYSYDSLTNGPGPTARFNSPAGVAVDAAGAVYVADTGSHIIRKISPAGVVSLLAGSWGNSGTADGLGAAARFESPTGVAVDAAGTVYVADQGSHAIRKITPAGRVTTLAGAAGQHGFTDGPGKSARFYDPASIAVDAAGTLYVADMGNHRIREISPTGEVSTLAGIVPLAEIRAADGMDGARGSADGPTATARFDGPTGVAVDATGTVYVVDRGNNAIRRVSPAGEVSTLAGAPHTLGHRNGPGAVARFDGPIGIAIDAAGALYVGDTGNQLIRKITPDGKVRTLAGTRPSGIEFNSGTRRYRGGHEGTGKPRRRWGK